MKINRLLLVLIALVYFSLNSKNISAQTYANSWINYNQNYYSFKIFKDGIYRISYSTLTGMGIPVGTIDPRNFQVFNNGEEQYIYVHNESTGVFGSTDYIEMYCKKNDGTADAELYHNAYDQPVMDNSLFTDTAVYYLTYNSSFNNRRVSIETSTNYSSYTEIPWVYKNSRLTFPTSEYSGGIPFGEGYYLARYTEGEGFYGGAVSLGGSTNYTLSTKNTYSSGPISKIDFVLKGSSNYANLYNDHHVRFTVGTTTIDTIFPGYELIKGSFEVPTSQLGLNTTTFKHQSINDLGSGADLSHLGLINLKYPHTLNFESLSIFAFEVPNNQSQSKSYLNISGFTGGNNPVLWDLTNRKKIIVTKNGTNYQALVPNSGGDKMCFITGETQITQVALKKVNSNGKFVDFIAQNPDANYIIITHPKLMGTDPTYKTANDYADYRASTGYNVMLLNIYDLYEQYGYGVVMSPLAIKNFLKRAYYELNAPPTHLFIIGKTYYPDLCRKYDYINVEALVPSYGYPPSDSWLSQGIIDSTYLPAIATGRLAARNLDQVDLYLEKVMKYEESYSTPEPWMKKALFFSGGGDQDEQDIISNYMLNYKNILEDTLFGANIFTIYKTSTDPIQSNLQAKITSTINDGVFMMNFFGHGSGSGFDIAVDHPSTYTNYGKYPFLIANSCYAGDIFQGNDASNSSEAFILVRDKGAIAYLSSVTPALKPWLNVYTSEFMKNLSYKNYGNTLGSNIFETVKNIKSTNTYIEDVSTEMILHGDPGIKLYSFEKPDYEVNNTSIIFNPQTVSTSVDSFQVKIAIANLGKVTTDTLLVEATRTLPNSATVIKTLVCPAPYFNDTVSIYFKTDAVNGIGSNKLKVNISSIANTPELSFSNNTTTLSFEVFSADLRPVFPSEFGIVGQNNITLSASTYYPLSGPEKYIFQVDTSALFDSPLFMEHKLTSSGGVVSWQLPFTLLDSSVYFWRVSKDSVPGVKGYSWRNSSFHYIPNRSGWSQSNYYQFENNNYKLVTFNKPERNFKFINNYHFLKVINGNPPALSYTEQKVLLNSEEISYWRYYMNSMHFYVFDQISGLPWMTNHDGTGYGPFHEIHKYEYDIARQEFPTETSNIPFCTPAVILDTVWYRKMANFLGAIPNGNTVLVVSSGMTNTPNFPEYLKKSFDTLGSNYIRSMYNNQTYILFGRKGDFGGAREIIGADNQSTIVMQDSIQTSWTEGSITSTIIGPSTKWQTLSWNQNAFNNINTDSVSLSIIGITHAGVEDTLMTGISPDTSTITLLESFMPSATYPYCKLVTYMKDDSLHTAAQMDFWRIYYTEAPELAIAPKLAYEFYADTLEQGDTAKIVIGYQNISNTNSDSVLVKYWLIDANKVKHDLLLRRIAPINAGAGYIDSLSFPTLNLLGRNELYIEINTINPATNNIDQLEVTHDNNSLTKIFHVIKDNSRPILDVTFDGVHILDGDIVSPKPEILISLTDDNSYIQLDDTSLFQIYIKSPGEITEKRIYFYQSGVEVMKFVPAELPKNMAKIIFNAEFKNDGEYTLILKATDKAGNESSPSNDYKISFEVINKSTITEVMNWPNPFTTKTHFVFTLTGSQVPDYFLIQVMTISGHVVREISMDELGPIHVGRNITEYAWDGTDQYGDRLANGVYLYRVITKIQGQEIEHSQTEADKYFKNNFGKMYLMR